MEFTIILQKFWGTSEEAEKLLDSQTEIGREPNLKVISLIESKEEQARVHPVRVLMTGQ